MANGETTMSTMNRDTVMPGVFFMLNHTLLKHEHLEVSRAGARMSEQLEQAKKDPSDPLNPIRQTEVETEFSAAIEKYVSGLEKAIREYYQMKKNHHGGAV
jgi:hypothetical protein